VVAWLYERHREVVNQRRGKGDRLLFWRVSWPTARTQRGVQAQSSRDGELPVCGSEGLLPIHAGAQSGEFMLEERLIDPRQPGGRDRDRRRIPQLREAQARPGPGHGVLDQPGANRIAEDVPDDREEMAVLLNGNTVEAALPHMPLAPVMAMVAAEMADHPPRHEGAQGRIRHRLHDQMEMIGHQTEAQELDGVCIFAVASKSGVVEGVVNSHLHIGYEHVAGPATQVVAKAGGDPKGDQVV